MREAFFFDLGRNCGFQKNKYLAKIAKSAKEEEKQRLTFAGRDRDPVKVDGALLPRLLQLERLGARRLGFFCLAETGKDLCVEKVTIGSYAR